MTVDILNDKFRTFFKAEGLLNTREYLIHDLHPSFNSIIWRMLRSDGDGELGLSVSGSDVKHVGFPNLNIPVPLTKRR